MNDESILPEKNIGKIIKRQNDGAKFQIMFVENGSYYCKGLTVVQNGWCKTDSVGVGKSLELLTQQRSFKI